VSLLRGVTCMEMERSSPSGRRGPFVRVGGGMRAKALLINQATRHGLSNSLLLPPCRQPDPARRPFGCVRVRLASSAAVQASKSKCRCKSKQ
jgi:hypothetical protein